jgi:hypothetical protein
MSTQIRELLAKGKYTRQQAMDLMSTKLWSAGRNQYACQYMINPSNANYQAMHTAAQNMASLIGSQMGQVISTSGSTTIVDVNRYRGMMGTIFSNMSSFRGSGTTT